MKEKELKVKLTELELKDLIWLIDSYSQIKHHELENIAKENGDDIVNWKNYISDEDLELFNKLDKLKAKLETNF